VSASNSNAWQRTAGAEKRAVMQAQLVASVQHSLSMYLYDNAKFLCERLAAEFPSEVQLPTAMSRPQRHRCQCRPRVSFQFKGPLATA